VFGLPGLVIGRTFHLDPARLHEALRVLDEEEGTVGACTGG
jgi:hypothetical protein